MAISPFRSLLWLAYTLWNGLQIYFLFRLSIFKWLSRRPHFSVIPFTATLDSVRLPKGMSRCCPAACVSLSSWVCLYLPTADVSIVKAALPGMVFLRCKSCEKCYQANQGGAKLVCVACGLNMLNVSSRPPDNRDNVKNQSITRIPASLSTHNHDETVW